MAAPKAQRTMRAPIQSAEKWFRQIYLDGVPILLRANETAFLSFLCVVAATDALAGYRYATNNVGDRFSDFISAYFPGKYAPHAANLYLFRCRMLHNFSPAHFTLVHASPRLHLTQGSIGDTILSDESFFVDMKIAAEHYFADLSADSALQLTMQDRLRDLNRGGAIYVE
jgi:hypothetical protein